MNIYNIIPQIFGLLALTFWILSVQTKNKSKILKFQAIANIFYAIQYFLLNVITAGCMNLISVSRSICYYENDSKKKNNPISLLFFFIIIIIIFGAISFSNILSLIPIFITIIYTYATWQKNTKVIRWSFIIAACIWIYYNILVGAYVSLIGNFFELISGFISIIRFDLKKK